MELFGKVAVVTGASSGIGSTVARLLSEAGAKLVLTARRAERLTVLAGNLPCEAAILDGDITDPGLPERLLALACERFGRADILINNAGFMAMGPIDTIDLDQVTTMLRVNYEALVRSSYVFARAMKAQKSGAIINVSSIGAYTAAPMIAAYSGTKHAVEGFTDGLRIELAGSGVRVGVIAPGSTQTDMLTVIQENFESKQDVTVAPEDIARGILFMLQQPDNANVARMLICSSNEHV